MITGAALLALGAFIGFSPFIYLIIRALGNEEWDSSNLLNLLRVLAHIALHPGDLAYMWYVRRDSGGVIRLQQKPFGYISGDEFSENYRVRPPKGAFK